MKIGEILNITEYGGVQKGSIVCGGVDAEELVTFYYLVRHLNNGEIKLFEMKHFDRVAADDKMVIVINFWNTDHPNDRIELAKTCSPREGIWLSEYNHAQ